MNYDKDKQPIGSFDPEMTMEPRLLRGTRTFNSGDLYAAVIGSKRSSARAPWGWCSDAGMKIPRWNMRSR
jgi:hypothetical protein